MDATSARGLFQAGTRETVEAKLGPPVFEDDDYAVYAQPEPRDALVIQKKGMGYGCPCIPGCESYHEGINRAIRHMAVAP